MGAFSSAWHEGYAAYQQGENFNPYTPGTTDYDDWSDGWWTALADEANSTRRVYK